MNTELAQENWSPIDNNLPYTCPNCGELFNSQAEFDKQLCQDCQDAAADELMDAETSNEDEEEICGYCNGSGEGMYDGTHCHACHGRGTV